MAIPIAPAPGDLRAILINNDAEVTNDSDVDLILSAQGAPEMLISNEADFAGAVWEPYLTARQHTLKDEEVGPGFGDGDKTVYVKFRSAALEETIAHSAVITLDTKPPVVGAMPVIINEGELRTSNRDVILLLDATGSTVVEIFNEDQQEQSFPFATTIPHTLSEGNGQKEVFVDFQDDIGNSTGAFSAKVTLVGQASSQPVILDPNEGTFALTDKFINVTGSGDPEATIELQIDDLYGA